MVSIGLALVAAAPASATSDADSAVATGGPEPATASLPSPDTVFVSADLTARVAAAEGDLGAFRGPGLTIPVTCSAGCRMRARVTTGGVVVARGSAARLDGGLAMLLLRVDGDAGWSPAHRTAARVTIALTVSDRDGLNRTLVRRLLLR